MSRFSYLVAALLAFPVIASAQDAKGKVSPELSGVVIPFLQKHCIACHGPEKKRGELSLHQFKTDEDLLKARKIWYHVAKTVHSGRNAAAGEEAADGDGSRPFRFLARNALRSLRPHAAA
ncbi:MAG: hypothetical protein U0744_14300 [Gemmataceae bacterium]